MSEQEPRTSRRLPPAPHLPPVPAGGGPLVAPMPPERPTTLTVNGEELIRLQTTPVHLHDWVTGFLFAYGMLRDPAAVRSVAAVDTGRVVTVQAQVAGQPDPGLLRQPPPFAPVRSDMQVTRAQLAGWMEQMNDHTPLYRQTGGMHAAMAVRVPTGEILVREDIGRRTALDKTTGACLRAGWPPEEVVMLLSGRVSHDLAFKLARYGVGIGASRTAVTDAAHAIAVETGMELVGYLRSAGRMVVYTAGRRILD